ncbi:MAG: beta-galactosidase [Firmicutes bacterium]|nr:beta-galactosidase [Bacillota bacterium]
MVSQRLYGLGLVLLVVSWILVPLPVEAATTPYVPIPILVDHFDGSLRASFIPNNGLPSGGRWTALQQGLVADNYGAQSPLATQIASVPHVGENVVLVTSFTINQVNPAEPYRIGVFGRGSPPGTGTSQWDIALSHGQLALINQGVGTPASIPFAISAGQTYDMVALINGTWVAAKVWLAGAPEPTAWTIAANFVNTGPFTTVGVVAANADVTFHAFGAYEAPPTLSVSPTQLSGVYQSGQAVSYLATVTPNAPNQGGSYDIQYQIVDAQGNQVQNGTVPVTLTPGQPVQVPLTLPISANGAYVVTFRLTTSPVSDESLTMSKARRRKEAATDGLSLSSLAAVLANPLQENTARLAVVPDATNLTTLAPDSAFGINGPGNGYGPITPSLESKWMNVYRLFKEQGVEWVRTQLLWNNIEPSPGVYTWNTTDGLVEAAHAAHENLLGLLDYWGRYANPFPVDGGPQVSFSTFLQDYDQYVQAVVSRYMPGGTLAQALGWHSYGITAWEIWNEPSQPAYWPSESPVQYAELVASATAAIHAVDPSAIVLAYAWQPSTLINTAGPLSFNGLSIHEYSGRAYPSLADFYETIANLRQLLTQNGVGSDPIWMTETGWSTQVVTPLQQAEYIERAAIESLAASLNKFFLFKWSYPALGYGELTANDGPLPSYAALAAVAHELAGFQPAAGLNPINMGAAIQAFAFQNGSTSLIALWSTSTSGRGSLTVNPAGANLITAANWMGNPIPPKNGTLTVPLTPEPVFLTGTLPPTVLEALVTTGTVNGIAPATVFIHPLSPNASGPLSIAVTVINNINVPEMGSLTLALPPGWIAEATDSEAPATPSNSPTAAFGPLEPGAAFTETFTVVQRPAGPPSPVTMTATASLTVSDHPVKITTSRSLTPPSDPDPASS